MLEPSNALSRQLAVLAKLNSGSIAPASEYFAKLTEDGSTPNAQIRRRSRFTELFPEAECLTHENSNCWRVSTWASLCGKRTQQGYSCPVLAYGAPPNPRQIAFLTGDAAWSELDPARILYLDTETTSLSSGSGTYTFLIGLGHFAVNAEGEPGFTVVQYFMEDYDGEAALVAAVATQLEQAQALVTYNGRAYDVPLLETRWTMQLRTPRFPELHLDLLHYARRLWRLRLPGCGLGEVEKGILKLRRHSDVNGSWVPRIYFDFVNGIRAERIVPVFDHHAQDIFSMAALVAIFTRALEQPDHPDHAHASDQWGLARLWAARGEIQRTLDCLEAAGLAARDEDLGFRLAMHLARLYLRAGRTEDAVAIWEARLPQVRPGRIDPLIELAKHAEHVQRDFLSAKSYVRRALEILDGASNAMAGLFDGALPAETTVIPQLALLNQRLARLLRREEGAQAKAAKRAARECNRTRGAL